MVLRDFHVVGHVEVPGQYFTDQEVALDHTVKLDRVGADISIVRRHGNSFRRLTLIGSDGSQRHFIVQTSLTPNARSDERILQLFRVMNQMFDKHKESRRCHICIHTPMPFGTRTRPRVEASASLRCLVASRLSAPRFAAVAPVE